MSLKRKISKRFEFNEYEAELLRKKSFEAGLKECQLVRELITGYAPTEKPGLEFYKCMNNINKIGKNINQIAAVANETKVIDVEYLKQCIDELNEKMLEVKTIVLKAKPYSSRHYDDF